MVRFGKLANQYAHDYDQAKAAKKKAKEERENMGKQLAMLINLQLAKAQSDAKGEPELSDVSKLRDFLDDRYADCNKELKEGRPSPYNVSNVSLLLRKSMEAGSRNDLAEEYVRLIRRNPDVNIDNNAYIIDRLVTCLPNVG